jgi:hypothetical protein
VFVSSPKVNVGFMEPRLESWTIEESLKVADSFIFGRLRVRDALLGYFYCVVSSDDRDTLPYSTLPRESCTLP